MMQGFTKKVVDYEYHDFSEEFGAEPVRRDDDSAINVGDYDNYDFTPDILGTRIPADDYDDYELAGESFDDGSDMSGGSKGSGGYAASAIELEAMETRLRDAEAKAQTVLTDAYRQAEELKEHASIQAAQAVEDAKNEAYERAFEEGRREGYERGLSEGRMEFEEKNHEFFEDIQKAIAELERQKTDFIRKHANELRDLSVAIAEQVIKVSLQSSGEVIKRMILNAVEGAHGKQWAKIYVSEHDASMLVKEDDDILSAIAGVSDHIKIEIMENGSMGDLMVEFPDAVIDAGASTQLEKIRNVLEESSF